MRPQERQEVPEYLLAPYHGTLDELCSTCPLAGSQDCEPAYGLTMLHTGDKTAFDLVDLAIKMHNETTVYDYDETPLRAKKRIVLHTDEKLSGLEVVQAFEDCHSPVLWERRFLPHLRVCSAINSMLGTKHPTKDNVKIQEL